MSTIKAALVGPSPRYVLIPYRGRDIEFRIGEGPQEIPAELRPFLEDLSGFDIEVPRTPFLTESRDFGSQLLINI